MDFVSVRDLRVNTGAVWARLEREQELVVTLNGRPIALMTGISGSNLETMLDGIRRARFDWAVREARKTAKERGASKMSLEEIQTEIRKSRQGRNR